MTDHDKILGIIARIKQREPESIDLAADIASLGIDSLDVVELLMKLEDEFDVYLSVDLDISDAKTVGNVIDFLVQKIGESKNG